MNCVGYLHDLAGFSSTLELVAIGMWDILHMKRTVYQDVHPMMFVVYIT